VLGILHQVDCSCGVQVCETNIVLCAIVQLEEFGSETEQSINILSNRCVRPALFEVESLYEIEVQNPIHG
jgi:hypothetical protein